MPADPEPEPEPEPEPGHPGRTDRGGPTLTVVLSEPEIAGNVGAIGRTCVAAGAALRLVRPLGFHLDDPRRRRAGLDYWPHLALDVVDSLGDAVAPFGPDRTWYYSTRAGRPHWDAPIARGDALVFGPESRGLPAALVDSAIASGQALRIPIRPEARSLNLGASVAIALYEALRRTGGL